MPPKPSEKILHALAVCTAITGYEMPEVAARLIAQDLAYFPENSVLVALDRIRMEITGRFSYAQILERIPGQHPGVEQAWAACARALTDETVTMVWTHEMARAFGVALGAQDDVVAARMAFKAEYQQQVANARQKGVHPEWFVSPGTDAAARSGAALEGVREGKLPLDYAQQFVLDPDNNAEFERLVAASVKALPA